MTSKAQRKRGYPIPPDPRTYPLICVSLRIPDHPAARAAVRSQLDRLSLWASWEKSYTIGDTRAKEMAAYWRELMYLYYREGECEGVTDMPNDFRQSPDDPCILQYSKDGGSTWYDAYNFADCSAAAGTGGIDIATEITLEIEINEYNTTIMNIYNSGGELAPDYLGQDADKQRDILCYFLGLLIDEIIDSFIAVKDAQQEEGEKIPTAAALGLGLASALLAIPTGGGSLLLYATLGTLFGGTALSAWLIYDDYDPGILSDEQARTQAKCWLLEQWSGTLPDEATFRGLDPSTAPETFRDIIEVLASGFDDVEVYANFRNSVNTASAIPSFYPVCDCEQEWGYRWDFTASDGSFTADYPTRTGRGVHHAGTGWGPTVGSGLYIRQANVIPSTSVIEKVKMFGSGRPGNNNICNFVIGELPGGSSDDHVVRLSLDSKDDAISPDVSLTGRPGDFAFVQAGSGDWRVVSISISGSGTKPAFTGGEWQ